MEDCRNAMAELAMDVLTRLASVSVGDFAIEGSLRDQFAGGPCVFRAVLYRSIEPAAVASACGTLPNGVMEHAGDELLRCEPHTDLGSLTVLDSVYPVDALQVRTGSAWADILPPPDTLLVNVGDELERWTSGAWRAPVHRVALPSAAGAEQRLSLIFFQNPKSIRADVERYLWSSSNK
jgi:hypothetical protein